MMANSRRAVEKSTRRDGSGTSRTEESTDLSRRRLVALFVLEGSLAEQQDQRQDEQRQEADAGQQQHEARRQVRVHGRQRRHLHAIGARHRVTFCQRHQQQQRQQQKETNVNQDGPSVPGNKNKAHGTIFSIEIDVVFVFGKGCDRPAWKILGLIC